MNRERRGRVVVITGATAGVGRATARIFAREGARIGLIARGVDRLQATRREVEALGGQALALPCDVADAAAVEEAAAEVEETFGPIDVWINNAMATVFAPVHEIRAEEFARVTEVTYLGTVHGTLAALQRMREREHGHIIQVGSALAFRSIPLQSAYCAAKHAVEGFTESLRTELLHQRSAVALSAVHLPAMNTPQFTWSRSRMPYEAQPVPPIYEPEVAARAIAWVADHPRRAFLVAPSTVVAVLGNRVAPAVGDRWLARTGFSSQQTDALADPRRPDNLFAPVAGDRGARGPFSTRARRFSLQSWANAHRAAIGLAVGLGLVAVPALRALATRR